MRIKTMIIASILGLVFLMNYGCGFFAGASIGKADGYRKDHGHGYIVQSPIGKDASKLTQTKTPPQG